MITKGILKTINYNENSCTVRIPLFETTSSTNEVVLPAIFLTQPGSYNGYSEGDVVFVDFENNSLSNPIIIGKLYLGAIKEKATSKKGGLTIADLSVTSSATLPLDTKLTFNAADETVASVEGGYNTYKSLLDIIKALYKTETSVSKTTEEALENITKIKVEYLSQLVTDPEPLKEDPNWSISMPNYKDGYNIWQKTTCYNSKGQILSTEIICLSAANAIASYWLRCSTKIHSGTQQAETIEITAMTKLGTSPETADEESNLTYRWSKGADKKPEVADPETPYKLIFRNTAEAPLPNENLIITAYRNGAIYESETIFFSPLNTPTLVLTNENASLEYDSYGFTKMPGAAEFVESTAVIKLNNETITAKSYEWTVKNCSFDSKIGTNTATIRITDIDESSDSATATCEAIYVDNVGNEVPLTKVFSISKIKQGRSLYKLDLSNEFVTIPAVDDGKGSIKIADDYDWDYLTSHTVNAYYGDELLKVTCSTQTPSSSASEKAFHLKYTVNNVSLKSEINQATESEGVTFVLDNLTGKTGTILYELFRGNKKVASSKFEATRLDSGTPATSYWLNISSPIHTGVRQESDIKIQPKLETGNSGQDNDILAYIRCKYVGETSYIEVSKNVDTGEVTLTAPLKDKNILVEASHTEDFSNIYESETITFSPLNTPVIDLTNDSAALTYTAGGLKINKEEGKEDIVESTATLYLNGKPVEGVTYSWTYTDCIIEGTTNSQTIKIKGLLAPKGTATCSVSYWGETFTKVFSITKQIQGEASTSYWLKTSCVVHTGTNQEKAIEAIAMKKVGEEAEKPDGTAKLYYRYYNDENWIGGSSTLKIENYKNEDLYIVASHKESFIPNKTLEQADSDIYDWETITFSPLNTPVLDLTNDSDSLTYNAENNKIELPGQTASVTSTAALYLNGDEVNGATYSWTVEGCSTTDYTVSSDNKTITISAIAENSLSVNATCTATYNGKPYSKVFSVVKQVIATTYWLKVSHPVHVGTNQTEPIRIVAMKKEGTNAETLDNTAYLWYKYKDATTWTKVAEESPAYVLNINGGWEDKDLTIFASHKSYKNKDFTNEEVTETSTEIYDWEVITFSPLNTPTINLTNDTASLVYNYDDTKYSNDVVSTTAELYLNGTHITDGIRYEWTADENKCTFKGSTNSAIIQVKEIATGNPTATATCKITIGVDGIGPNKQFAGRSYEKKFHISKQFKGDPTTSYWIAPSTKIIKINADNTIATDTIEFQIIKKSGTKTPEAITLTSGESLKLKVGINGQTLNDFNGKATDNIYSIDTLGVSTSITIALYDNDTEIDRETISVVKDGIDGKSAYKIDIANDFVTIPTDYSGTIQLDTDALKALATHTITLYYGEDSIKPNWISSQTPNSTMGLRYTISTGLTATIPASSSEDNTISVENITALTTDTGSILYEIVKDEKVLASAKFEASKIKSGEPTTYYRLEVSSSTVVRHSDGTRTPTGIDIYCYKYTGSTKTQVKDFYLIYTKDSHVPQTLQAVDPAINPNATYPGYIHMGTGGLEDQLILELCLKDPGNVSDYQYDAPVLDKETVLAIYDGVDGAGGDTFEVQQAFAWVKATNYAYVPKAPTLSATAADKGTNYTNWGGASTENNDCWSIFTAPPTEEWMSGTTNGTANTDNWGLVFTSTRVKTEHANGSEPTFSAWTAPEIYLCKNWGSYYTVTISEGLFGNGQGVYYTYDPTAEVFKDDQDKEINPPATITIASTEYKIGEQIKKTQEEIAQWVATANLKEPLDTVANRKKVIKLYVDAKYIRTGALTVGDSNNPLFQAGLDENKVSIGGFTVENNKLCSGSGGGHIALQSGDSKLMSSTQAEYIMSTGEQYINTGITYNANTAYKLTARIAFTTVEPANQILGFTGHVGTGIGTDGNKWWEIGSAAGNIVPNTIYNIEWSLNGTNFARGINGQIVEGTNAPINIPTHYTLNLFATQHTSTNPTISWWQHMKLYNCQIYVDGKLVKNYIPVQRNGKYGLFNTVDSTFTTGEGTDFLGSLKENEAAYITKNGKNYRRVSYIQNKGGTDRSSFNYIDTDVIVNHDEGFTIEAEYEPAGDTTQAGSSSRCCIASNYVNEAGNISLEIMQGSSRFYLNNGWGWDHSISGIELNKKSKSIFSYASGTATHSVEGKDTASKSITISGNAGSSPLRIFCDKYPDANDGLPGRMDTFYVPLKLYYLKISKGASVARYYLPVVEEATNKVGLLDIIHGTFLTQTAGVDFSYAELPPTAGETFKDASNNTYTTLSYLKSTGSQYINTGVKASNNTSIEVDCEVLTPYSVYGTINGLNYTASPEYPGGYFYYYNIHNTAGAGAPIAANSRMIVKQDKNKCYRNGLLVHTYTNSTFTEKSPMLLFARNGSTDGGVSKNDAGSVKIYYCKIWEANVLIRDFIPVLKNGAEYGMYERVEGKFYNNRGTDVFSGEGIVSHEFNSIYLGSDIEATAPFRVTNTGKLFATGATISGNISADSGTIGGFSLSDTSFKTLRTEDNGYGNVDNPDVLITTRGYSQWGKVANRDGTDWRLLIGQNFGIAQGGILYCDQALIKGNIVATSGEIQNMTQITADYVSAKNTLSGDSITANTNLVAPQATIAGFELKAVDTSDQVTKTKTVSLKLNTSTTKYVSDIATYIGGSWLFTLAFACFSGTTPEKFIESRSLSDLVSIQWATFESDTKKTVQVGSSTSTLNIVSKVYFNGTILNAYSGSTTVTTTVSAGGNGASPSAQWKLREVYLKVFNKKESRWEERLITTSGSEIVKITDFKYKANTTNTKLLLNGGVVIAGNLTPNGSVTLGEESTPWTKAFITEVYATTFYASSDKRLKENIKEFIPQKSILELPVVEFDFKNTKSHQIGCIAQDLQKICPELVTTSETGYLAISENKLVYLLLLELKKLHSKVTMLEDELKKGMK